MNKNAVLALVALTALGSMVAVTSADFAIGGPRGAVSHEASVADTAAMAAATLPAYPPPPWGTPTPMSPSDWEYATASGEEIAATVLGQLIERGRASAEAKVLHVSDFSSSNAEILGLAPEIVLAGSPVDVAVTVEGEVVPLLAGSYGAPRQPGRYAVIIVDRASGTPYGLFQYDRLDQVPTVLR